MFRKSEPLSRTDVGSQLPWFLVHCLQPNDLSTTVRGYLPSIQQTVGWCAGILIIQAFKKPNVMEHLVFFGAFKGHKKCSPPNSQVYFEEGALRFKCPREKFHPSVHEVELVTPSNSHESRPVVRWGFFCIKLLEVVQLAIPFVHAAMFAFKSGCCSEKRPGRESSKRSR